MIMQTTRMKFLPRCSPALGLALCLVLGLLLLAAPAVLNAQQSGGTLVGSVLDANSGKYLEGAEVVVQGTELRAVTERDGSFTLPNVPAGLVTVVVSYPGMDPKTFPVTISAGQTANLIGRLASEVIAMEVVKVTSTKEGMAQAVALQKIAIQTKLVAAADQFGVIAEGNIGEYLKFMPGVSIDYNVNDARGISLRGLSTAFTIVAVDGTPMAGASSVDDTRRFEFEQIAMNNVETTELFKTVTPDIAATSTGGFVNFVTKSAFDHQDQQRLTYDLTFAAPSSNLSLSKQGGVWGHNKEFTIRPGVELNYSRKVNRQLGVNFNYRLSEKYDDSPRTEYTWATAATAPTVMTTPRLQQYNVRQEQKLTHREAFATKLDYLVSDATKLTFSGQWNWYDLDFTQRGPQFVLGAASTRTGDTFTSGATGANIQNNVLYREKYGTTVHFNATASHRFENQSKLSVTPYWSRADGQYRDTSKGFISSFAGMAPGAATYSAFSFNNALNLGTLPTISLVQGTAAVPLDFIRNLGNYTFSNSATGTAFQSRPWTAIDRKKGFRTDYSHKLDGIKLPVTLQAGYQLDQTHRTIDRPDWRGVIPATTGAALTVLRDPNYAKDVALGFGTYQAADPFKVWDTFKTAAMTLNVYDKRDIEEENNAAYLRADAQLRSDLLFVGGLRWEKRTIAAAAQTGAPARARSATADLDFDAWYPSLSLKYTPRRHIVARAGFSRTIGIPDYGEMLPSFVTPTTSGGSDGTISVPSGNLKPYSTNNFDLAVDYFLKSTGVVGISLFRKEVKDFIITRTMTATERTQYLTDYGLNPADFGATSGSVRENGSKSSLQGFEISYAQNLQFLPKPFNGLNLQANFTYTDIDASDADPFRAIDTLYSQSRAVSPKTANFVIGYRYRKFNTTITTNWVDEALYGGFVSTNYVTGTANTANPALDTRLAFYKDEKTTIDWKVEYAITPRISAYFLVRNINNTPRKEFLRGYLPQYQNVVLPYRYFEFGEPHLTLGFRGTF
jgi:TonB-dependent receptor